MSKHTPGPWHRDKYGNVVDSNGERVVMRSVAVACSGSDEYIALAEANTDLATAAPDLLGALDRLTKWAETMAEAQTCEHTGDHPIAIARAALIKALTGESQ